MARKAKPMHRADVVRSILDPATMELGAVAPSVSERDAVLAALKEKASDGASVDIGNALRYLVDGDPEPEVVKLATQLLLDNSRTREVRRHAAAALARVPGKEADAALAKALNDTSEIGETPLLTAVARAGGKAALTALRKLPEPATPYAARMRAYAETAITYRLGEKPSAAAERATVPAASPFRIVRETKAKMAEAVASLEGRPFGLAYRDDLGFSFDCAGCRHVVLLNAEIAPGKLLDVAKDTRMIAGIIAMDDGRSGRLIQRSTIFVRPEKEGARVSVVRTSGEVMMAGRLVPRGDGLDLNLRDLSTERWPVEVTGRVTPKTLDLSAQVFVSGGREQRTGEAVQMPEIRIGD